MKKINCPHCKGKIVLKDRILQPIGTTETKTDYKGNTARWYLQSRDKQGIEIWSEA